MHLYIYDSCLIIISETDSFNFYRSPESITKNEDQEDANNSSNFFVILILNIYVKNS